MEKPAIEGSVHPELTLDEVSELARKQKDPADYCVLNLPITGMQAVPHGGALVFTLATQIPESVLPLKTLAMLDAQGQPQLAKETREAFPIAPTIRMVVTRSALSPAMQAEVQAMEERAQFVRHVTTNPNRADAP